MHCKLWPLLDCFRDRVSQQCCSLWRNLRSQLASKTEKIQNSAKCRTETICRSSFNDNSETLLPPESAFNAFNDPNANFSNPGDLKVLWKHRQKSLRSRPAANEGLWSWQLVEFSLRVKYNKVTRFDNKRKQICSALEDMNMPSPDPTKTKHQLQSNNFAKECREILLSCRLSTARGTH